MSRCNTASLWLDDNEPMDGGTACHHERAGLGLTIVKKLTQAMGGGISLESELGKGTTFRVELPLQTAYEHASIVNEAAQ
jgi:signal transduction histidine kinase